MIIKENELYVDSREYPQHCALVTSVYDDIIEWIYINSANEKYLYIRIVKNDVIFFNQSIIDFCLSKKAHKNIIKTIFRYEMIKIEYL